MDGTLLCDSCNHEIAGKKAQDAALTCTCRKCWPNVFCSACHEDESHIVRGYN